MFAATNTFGDCINIYIYNKLFDPKICLPKNFPEQISLGHKDINIKVLIMNNDENIPSSSASDIVPLFLFNKNIHSSLTAVQFLHENINYARSIFIGVDVKSKKNLETASPYLDNYIKQSSSIYLELDGQSIQDSANILYPALKLIFDFKPDCHHEFPIPNGLDKMNNLFEEIYICLLNESSCKNKNYYSKYLKLLREAAFQEVKEQKNNIKDKFKQNVYLGNVLSLAIINRHLYLGIFAAIKNRGPTDTFTIIEGWKHKLDKEELANVEFSSPRNFRVIG